MIFTLKSILTRSQFLIISGILVGSIAGLARIIIKSLVHHIQYLITAKVHFQQQIWYYMIFPFLGIVITPIVVKYIFNEKDKKGIPVILEAIVRNASDVSRLEMYSQIVPSVAEVGLERRAGLESPIAITKRR